MSNAVDWFGVHRKGLAEILERRGKAWALYELIANAFDEPGVTFVNVRLEPEDGKPWVDLIVEDDAPNGFLDLADSWTLFAPSKKKGAIDKRGRFNFGCKLVLAMCREATIVTTSGGVVFDNAGRRTLRHKREKGSEFAGVLRMTRDEMREAIAGCRRLIVPDGIVLTVNGEPIRHRTPIKTFGAIALMTDVADADGILKRSYRGCDVALYRPEPGETAAIYELGIPVVETGDAFHCDVRQKVPLSLERDNVPPSFLRDLRAQVLNCAHDLLDGDAKASSWVTDAITDPCIDAEAVAAVVTARFGERRVAYDPSDREANNRAVAEGYTVVHGRSLPAEAWDRIREANLIPAAGRVTPTASGFSDDAEPYQTIDISSLSADKRKVVGFLIRLGKKLIERDITVHVVADGKKWPTLAAYRKSDALLIINHDLAQWYSTPHMIALALHEFGHEYEGNHLSEGFHDALCMLGAKLAIASQGYLFSPTPTAEDDLWKDGAS